MLFTFWGMIRHDSAVRKDKLLLSLNKFMTTTILAGIHYSQYNYYYNINITWIRNQIYYSLIYTSPNKHSLWYCDWPNSEDHSCQSVWPTVEGIHCLYLSIMVKISGNIMEIFLAAFSPHIFVNFIIWLRRYFSMIFNKRYIKISGSNVRIRQYTVY